MSRRVTIRDVAKEANVSSATVSNVLNNNDYHVSDETKRTVLAAIERLGYKPNRMARGLKRRSHFSFVIVIAHAGGPHVLSDPMIAEVLRGITDQAKEAEHQLTLHITDSWDPAFYERTVSQRNIDGAIVLGAKPSEPILAKLDEDAIPCIVIDQPDAEQTRIGPDHQLAGRLMMEHLVQGGRRNPYFLLGPNDDPRSEEVLSSSWLVLARSGGTLTDDRVLRLEPNQENGAQAVERLIASKQEFDALVTMDDLVALGAVRSLRKAGIRVPQDVAVIGYGNTPLCEMTETPLTSVDLGYYGLGHGAAAFLAARLSSPEVPIFDMRMPVKLITRVTA